MCLNYNTPDELGQVLPSPDGPASNYISKAHKAAVKWLRLGHWPVPITAITAPVDKPGKEPAAGKGWGKVRPTEQVLAELY